MRLCLDLKLNRAANHSSCFYKIINILTNIIVKLQKVFKNILQPWVPRLGPKVVSHGWVPWLGPTVGSQGWVSRLGPKVGSQG